MTPRVGWTPAAVLVAGAVLATVGVKAQRALPLRVPLSIAVPDTIDGLAGRDARLSDAEARVAAVSTYLVRSYQGPDTVKAPPLSVYVGYYDQQTQGQTIHSPKNCLPGAGWEPLASSPLTIGIATGAVTVNRYLLQNGRQRALVLYWYQGRGRVAWDEYRVKWDLLHDAALRRRSDEALVRVVVPVSGTEADALRLATDAAHVLVPALYAALPS